MATLAAPLTLLVHYMTTYDDFDVGTIVEFVRSGHVVHELGTSMHRREFYDLYEDWCFRKGKHAAGRNAVYEAVRTSPTLRSLNLKFVTKVGNTILIKNVRKPSDDDI